MSYMYMPVFHPTPPPPVSSRKRTVSNSSSQKGNSAGQGSSKGHVRSPTSRSVGSDPSRGQSMTPRSTASEMRLSPALPVQLEPPEPSDPAARTFVQALYDFTKTDPSALSFNKGDIIEVYGRLESGWWDGQLDGVRGWFPSNFVQVIDTDLVLGQDQASESGFDTLTSTSHEAFDVSQVDMSHNVGHIDAGLDQGDFGWHAMGAQDPAFEDAELDHLSRGIMDAAEGKMKDDGVEFREYAEERRRKAERQKEAMLDSMNRFGIDELGPEEMDQFGVLPRSRRVGSSTLSNDFDTVRPQAVQTHGAYDTAAVEQSGQGMPELTDKGGNEESAWEPILTPDGQVYYHNTITGEDSWHLPPTDEQEEGYDTLNDDDHAFFNSFAGSSSTPFAVAGPSTQRAMDTGESFRPPPQMLNDLPHPWTAKISDDGREWVYYNRMTGQETRDRSQVHHHDRNLDNGSTSTPSLSALKPRSRRRPSIDVRRRRVAEWCARTRREFNSILSPPALQNMAWYVDQAQDALQEVRECAMQGGEAEEEISRAMDTFSQAAAMEAMARREDARLLLKDAHEGYKQSVRNLFTAFGYVGPMDGIIEMPRPKWADERTMLGVQGMLASSVHAVIHSGRPSDGAANVWQALKRDVNKCQDMIGSFPALVTPNAPADVQHGLMGKRVVPQFGFGTAGTIMAGRWGFGSLEQAQHLRSLDEIYLRQLRASKESIDKVTLPTNHAIDLIRAAYRFKLLLLDVDLAVSIDVDGEMSDRIHPELAKAYHDLVIRAGNALLDLEEATAAIDELCIIGLRIMDDVVAELRDRLDSWLELCVNAISSLFAVSIDQRILSEKGNLLDQIGHRSPLFIARHSSSRPQSLLSTASKRSKGSLDPSRIRGLDEELLDQYDSTEDQSESRDRAGALMSASTNASQSSLALQSQQQFGRNLDAGLKSAGSSTTSLGYGQTESDAGGMRSKRTSLMKFMKGRSASNDEGRSALRNKKKLAKIFGEDEFAIPSGSPTETSSATVPPPAPALAPPERPWYMGEDYAPEEIILDQKGSVKAATLNALVARLTPHGSMDTAFFQAFLLTFRSFTTGTELIELLIRRYHIEPPEPGLSETQLAEWKRSKQTPIRLRVSNAIRNWLDVHYLEAEDADVLDRIEQFAKTTLLDNGSELLSRQLVTLVNRRRQGEKDTQRRIVSGGMLSPPAPLLPKAGLGRPLKLSDINPIELARQLTILEFNYFQAIKPNECLNKAWQNNENKQLAPNVRQVIRMANILSSWVVSTILAVKQIKDRAAVVKYFIQTATELRALNNFSSMASVMAGLNSAPVLRLKLTMEFLSAKTNNQKAALDRVLDSTKNFQNYKEMLRTINPPCVPFFGFWLSALVFIEDGNKDYVQPSSATSAPNTGMTTSTSMSSLASSASKPSTIGGTETNAKGPKLINFFKRSLTSEILRDIQQYQSQPYNLAGCKPVSDWLMAQLESMENGQADMQELYEVSLKLEPRMREEERLTRLLHDSQV